MSEDIRERLRDSVMGTFREWGGQWNVSPVAPGEGAAPVDAWLLRVHSRPAVRGTVSVDAAEAYLATPSDAEVVARWEKELRPLFEAARPEAP